MWFTLLFFLNQIKPRIDYFLYYEGMNCMSCLVGRSSVTWFSSKIIIIIIPFIYGACWGCYLWICLYDTWCDVSLIVEAWRIWIHVPWMFFYPLLHVCLGIWFLLMMILQVPCWVQVRCRDDGLLQRAPWMLKKLLRFDLCVWPCIFSVMNFLFSKKEIRSSLYLF